MLVRLWGKFYGVRLVLYYCRFSVLVVVLGGGGLLFVQQGRELALRVGDSDTHALFFYLGVFFWALHSWFSCRSLVEFRFGRPNREKDPVLAWSVNHIPRIIAAGAYFCAVIALLFSWKQKDYSFATFHALLLLLTVITGIIFYFVLVKRRHWMHYFSWRFSSNDARAELDFIRKFLLPVTIFYSIIFTIGGLFAPAYFGSWVGSLGILFFALSSIVPVGSWLVYKTTRLDISAEARAQDFPVISALFLVAVGFSFTNDNHDIRTIDSAPVQQSLEEVYGQWAKSAPSLEGDIKPLIIVATAGGGIRASQWTATVLGGLIDAEPKFQNALFAISSVSGGSVGAAFLEAVLRERSTQCEKARGQIHDWNQTCYQWQTQKALSADFLAPTLAGMLYPDLMQRFLPVAIMPDRQRGLELGWEKAWRDRFENARTPGLADGFTQLPRNVAGTWLPVLMLNSTHMETGKRIVTTAIELEPGRFTDTVDFFQLTEKDLPLSTAAGNSARFPYISPPGTLPCGSDEKSGFQQRLLCRNGHILDGGYFENFGAITAMQLMQTVLQKKPGDKLKPIFVLISSDPELARTNAIEDDKPFTRLPTNRGANEAFGPVQGLLSPREGRGILAAKELRDWVNLCQIQPAICGATVKPEFFYFRMEVSEGGTEPALGWLLSEEAEQEIWSMLTCSNSNRTEFERLLHTLGTPAVHIEAASQCND